MARIRSIKPEFWTSEQIAECSPNARLLFIGLWTFSDDSGIHPANAMRLKMEIFPADQFSKADVQAMIDELKAVDLVREYEVNGERYWSVTGWKHQRIDQPTYKHPLPDGSIPSSPKRRRTFDERSPNTSGENAECSPPERSGSGSGSGEEEETNPTGLVAGNAARVPPCPHQNIVDLYHEMLPMCPHVRVMTKARQSYLRQRWSESEDHQSLTWWRNFFAYISRSPFLTGQADGRDGKPPFVADLEWITRPGNFAKIVEGRYHREVAA